MFIVTPLGTYRRGQHIRPMGKGKISGRKRHLSQNTRLPLCMFLLGAEYQRWPSIPCTSVWDTLAKTHLIGVSLSRVFSPDRWKKAEERKKEKQLG